MEITLTVNSVNLLGNRYSYINDSGDILKQIKRMFISYDSTTLNNLGFIVENGMTVINFYEKVYSILDGIRNFNIIDITENIPILISMLNEIKLIFNRITIEDLIKELSSKDYSKLSKIKNYVFIGLGGFNSHILSNIVLLTSLDSILMDVLMNLYVVLKYVYENKLDVVLNPENFTNAYNLEYTTLINYSNKDRVKSNMFKYLSNIFEKNTYLVISYLVSLKLYTKVFIPILSFDTLPENYNDSIRKYVDKFVDIIYEYHYEVERLKRKLFEGKTIHIYEDDCIEFTNLLRFPYIDETNIVSNNLKVNKIDYFSKLINYIKTELYCNVEIHKNKFDIDEETEYNSDDTLYIGAVSPQFRLKMIKAFKNKFIFCGHHNNEYEITNSYEDFINLKEEDIFVNETYGCINLPIFFTNMFDATLEFLNIITNYDQQNTISKHFIDIIKAKYSNNDLVIAPVYRNNDDLIVDMDKFTLDSISKEDIDKYTLGADRTNGLLFISKNTSLSNDFTSTMSYILQMSDEEIDTDVFVTNDICIILV